MNQNSFFKIRVYFTAVVTIADWAFLGWNHFNGGVPNHHILANEALPSISDWWGAVLIPVLTWFLLYRVQKRVFSNENKNPDTPNFLLPVIYGFAGALLFGLILSVFFTYGYTDIAGIMVLGLLPLAILFPIYRAECFLGFVLGMTFTFGTVLPTGIGAIFCLVGLVLYLYIRTILLYVGTKFATK
ncbi:hypothetical protein ACSX1A_04355 [Pontibacter sp. MBLB2868]|uniref:hypothetical protein n=1 Tax=Pontibacter sp. MBLB2868 TaxID=3451555 RepID=UPI003F756F4F